MDPAAGDAAIVDVSDDGEDPTDPVGPTAEEVEQDPNLWLDSQPIVDPTMLANEDAVAPGSSTDVNTSGDQANQLHEAEVELADVPFSQPDPTGSEVEEYEYEMSTSAEDEALPYEPDDKPVNPKNKNKEEELARLVSVVANLKKERTALNLCCMNYVYFFMVIKHSWARAPQKI